MKFSERFGFKKVRDTIQHNSIDEPLRNSLWSLFKLYIWDNVEYSLGIISDCTLTSRENRGVYELCKSLWFDFFKLPLDSLSWECETVYMGLRNYYYKFEWYEVYDFIQFVAQNYDGYKFDRDGFVRQCNKALERELSAYRFIDLQIAPITEHEQLKEVEQALGKMNTPIRAHLKRALELLSDRKSPDYRNSIKESISAVESLVVKTNGGKKGTLGQLIKILESSIGLHPALGKAFSNLYGYTSDEDGIRHAIFELKDIKFEDAKYFLVICSAFINYIEAKACS